MMEKMSRNFTLEGPKRCHNRVVGTDLAQGSRAGKRDAKDVTDAIPKISGLAMPEPSKDVTPRAPASRSDRAHIFLRTQKVSLHASVAKRASRHLEARFEPIRGRPIAVNRYSDDWLTSRPARDLLPRSLQMEVGVGNCSNSKRLDLAGSSRHSRFAPA